MPDDIPRIKGFPLRITTEQLRAACLEWEQRSRTDPTFRSDEERRALPAEQVAEETTRFVYGLLIKYGATT